MYFYILKNNNNNQGQNLEYGESPLTKMQLNAGTITQ